MKPDFHGCGYVDTESVDNVDKAVNKLQIQGFYMWKSKKTLWERSFHS